jgi:hypothetical protein
VLDTQRVERADERVDRGDRALLALELGAELGVLSQAPGQPPIVMGPAEDMFATGGMFESIVDGPLGAPVRSGRRGADASSGVHLRARLCPTACPTGPKCPMAKPK